MCKKGFKTARRCRLAQRATPAPMALIKASCKFKSKAQLVEISRQLMVQHPPCTGVSLMPPNAFNQMFSDNKTLALGR